jgi:hypothetical protein
LAKVVKIGKNTEGVNKRTEADLKEISSDIWQKVVKIGKNTEGVTSGCFDVKYDCKKIKKLF